MLVTVVVLRSFACSVGAGKIVEIESFNFQFVKADFVFPRRVHAHQNSPVLSQDVIDAPDMARIITVQTIIKGDAACV